MRTLLKILAAFVLTTPLAVNVVACGGDNANTDEDEVTENTNVQELLMKAKEQINLGLGDLVKEYKNLAFEDQFLSSGSTITSALNALGDSNTVITNKLIKNAFLNRLQENINNFVVDKYLVQNAELKPLLGNIPINQILIIDINQTVLTKIIFEWKKVDFGVQDYKPADPQYNITMWHKLTAQLKLKLAYKNESNIRSIHDFETNFSINYANTGANLRKIIDASTAKVEEKLQKFIIEIPPITSEENLENKVKNIIQTKINDEKVNIDKIEVVKTGILKKYDKYDSGEHLFEAMNKPTVAAAIVSLQAYLAPAITEFTNKLNAWIGTGDSAKKINANRDEINSFGTCTISNWTVSGLTLKPMPLNFVTVCSQTKTQWSTKTATALATIFHPKGTFASGRIDLITNNNLTIYMNPDDFDSFINTDKTIRDVSEYINEKVNNKAKAMSIINNNISLTLNGLWPPKINPTLSNSSIVKRVDNETFMIARNKGGMHGFNYLSIGYDNVHFLSGAVKNKNGKRILFNNWVIKKATTNVW